MRIFVNPSGQRENLGDSLLRRRYLNTLREAGALHILVGVDESYASGLGARAEDVIYVSKLAWLRAAFVSAITQRTTFALNAGEIVTGRNLLVAAVWQVPLILAMLSRRGAVVALGIAVRERPETTRRVLAGILRLCTVVTWRDPSGRKTFNIGNVQPDWAFGIRGDGLRSANPMRDTLAVAVRGDRPMPSDDWFDSVSHIAADQGLTRMIVVVQVERDRERAYEIAARLGAEVLDWDTSVDHRHHEQAVRSAYQGSACVISDRIHALIVGMTEGAVPIGLAPGDPTKVVKTFAPVTSLEVGWRVESDISVNVAKAQRLMDQRDSLLRDLESACDQIDEVSQDIRRLVAGPVSERVTADG